MSTAANPVGMAPPRLAQVDALRGFALRCV